MNDPHVAALIYQVRHNESVDYGEAKRLGFENDHFNSARLGPRSRSMSSCLRLVAPLFRSRFAMGMSTPQWAAACVMSMSRSRAEPSGMDPGGRVGAKARESRTEVATALANGGGTELPIWRAPCHLVT